jgi:glutathione S-transferase
MHTTSVAAYSIAAALLYMKMLVTVSTQGVVRLRTKRFQYPEDARHWGGEEAEDHPAAARAQRVLRNDGEGQPLFFALGAAYVLSGATPALAPVYFGVYVGSRFLHTWFFLRPRQPHRNRAFGLGVLCLTALAVHVLVRGIDLARSVTAT